MTDTPKGVAQSEASDAAQGFDVFVSYSRADRELVRRLVESLAARGKKSVGRPGRHTAIRGLDGDDRIGDRLGRWIPGRGFPRPRSFEGVRPGVGARPIDRQTDRARGDPPDRSGVRPDVPGRTELDRCDRLDFARTSLRRDRRGPRDRPRPRQGSHPPHREGVGVAGEGRGWIVAASRSRSGGRGDHAGVG